MLAAFAASVLLATADCDRYASIEAWQAPVLPAALAAGYPDGIALTADIGVDASGKLVSIDFVDGAPRALRPAFEAWLHGARFVPGMTNCKAASSSARVWQRFYPPASGVVGNPPVVAGADFANMSYAPGPCDPEIPITLKDGEHSYLAPKAATSLIASVGDVFAGTLRGERIAVVTLRCDYPVGFNEDARIYRIANGKAKYLATAASFALPAGDDPMPRNGWLHVSFAGDKLYVDAWTYGETFWLATTYGLRDGKLVKLFTEHHQRSGAALPPPG